MLFKCEVGKKGFFDETGCGCELIRKSQLTQNNDNKEIITLPQKKTTTLVPLENGI